MNDQPTSAGHTPTLHVLKTDPAVFQRVFIGTKTFEIRKDDRGFKIGDFLQLEETRFPGAKMKSGAPLEYTGRKINTTITDVLHGPIYGLEAGWVIISIESRNTNEPLKAERDALQKEKENVSKIMDIYALVAERDAYQTGCESAKRGENEWHGKWEVNQTEKINLRNQLHQVADHCLYQDGAISALKQKLENAPHDSQCKSRFMIASMPGQVPECTCWKSSPSVEEKPVLEKGERCKGDLCVHAAVSSCGERNDGYLCTRTKGHVGAHIACGSNHNHATWKNEHPPVNGNPEPTEKKK